MSNTEQSLSPQKISVIIPVKNEEESIRQLLEDLRAQIFQPAEIVITDGGSTDRTREIIRESQLTFHVPIVLIETEHAFPGRGRNLAIARATHEWLASLDGGIHPRPDWLERLVATAGRVPEAGIIYGTAEPVTDTYFTECAAITYVPGGRLTQFIASSLLRRSAWEAAGGFREDLRSGEDLLFFRAVKTAGIKSANCDAALVTWDLRPTLTLTYRRFALYSRNGMRAGLGREWQFNVARLYLLMFALLVAGFFVRPLLLLPAVILLLRAEKRIWRWYQAKAPERLWRELLNPRRVLIVMWINFVIDIATLYGVWQWFIHDRLVPGKKWRDHSSSV